MLRGALGLVGGPWGAAFIGGTAILTHFWQEHRKAKARVQELTDTLDKQTGAATENTRALVAKRLEDQGLLEVAERLGLKTADVTTAVIEQGSALDDIVDKLRNIEAANRVHTGQGAILFSMGRDAIDLREELTQTDSELNKATASFYANAEAARRVEEATGGAAAATGKSGKAYDDLTTKVNKARDAIFKLIDAENKKRNNALAVRGDQIALNQAMLDLKKQATEGAKGLKLNTQAGLDNNRALQDLASQWANSEQKVKNADGAYRRIRASFIDAATEMGATKKQAKELADRLLETPRKVEIKTSVPGLEAAIEAYERLAAAARRAYEARRGGVVRNAGGLQARADGGPVSRFTPYVVGERGPEIFMPKSDGQIIPNHQIRTGNGGGTPVGGGLTEADAKMLAKAMAPTLYDAVYRGMAQQQDISIGRGR
ncbi:MAG: hypothetical protein HZY75_13380 [Nocardioidaceae bacterium]|nr:MAG: hypothetical protein HZY75_13380 [Nocardioidaceae bacterium]